MASDGRREFDVAIAGAGPAGCAAALQLARAGASVALIEKRRRYERRVGETLHPATNRTLAELGLWEEFLQTRPLPSSCNASAWGSAELQFNDFVLGTEGNGWHVDRGAFERMLSAAARRAGAVFQPGTCVTSAAQQGARWRLQLQSGAQARACEAAFLIDASGRSSKAWIGREPARRLHDHLIAVACYAALPQGLAASGYTLVEGVDDGWFYSAPVSEEEAVVCYMTDADLYARASKREPGHWWRQLAGAPHTGSRFADARFAPQPFCAAAHSSVRGLISGENWLAIGDAALSLDPLSSSGIFMALNSGMRAAQVAAATIGGDTREARNWSQSVSRVFDSYLKTREKYYRQERRWRDSPFWMRRQKNMSPRGEAR